MQGVKLKAIGVGCTGCGIISYIHWKGFNGAELAMLNNPENTAMNYAGVLSSNFDSVDMLIIIAEPDECGVFSLCGE